MPTNRQGLCGEGQDDTHMSMFLLLLFSAGYIREIHTMSSASSGFTFYSTFKRCLRSNLLVCVVAVVHVVSSKWPLAATTCERHKGQDFFAQ